MGDLFLLGEEAGGKGAVLMSAQHLHHCRIRKWTTTLYPTSQGSLGLKKPAVVAGTIQYKL